MKEVYPILPPGGIGTWSFVVLMLALTALFVTIAVSSRTASIELGPDGLRVRSPLYGRMIPWSSIHADDARVVNLKAEPQLALSWRTNGIGMPGYGAGWFRLKNGQKALAFITDSTRVALIPTSGYTLLVSVADAEALVTAVGRWAGSAGQ